MKKAPLKMGPKGPMTGGGPLNATQMAYYRQRLREQQENALKYLKKKRRNGISSRLKRWRRKLCCRRVVELVARVVKIPKEYYIQHKNPVGSKKKSSYTLCFVSL